MMIMIVRKLKNILGLLILSVISFGMFVPNVLAKDDLSDIYQKYMPDVRTGDEYVTIKLYNKNEKNAKFSLLMVTKEEITGNNESEKISNIKNAVNNSSLNLFNNHSKIEVSTNGTGDYGAPVNINCKNYGDNFTLYFFRNGDSNSNEILLINIVGFGKKEIILSFL